MLFSCIGSLFSAAVVARPVHTEITNCTEVALRDAVAAGGSVTFGCDGTIMLTQPLFVLRNLTLDASGHQVTLDGGAKVRLLNVAQNTTLSLKAITLANGASLGRDGQGTQSGPTLEAETGLGGVIAATNAIISLDSCMVTNALAKGGNSFVYFYLGEQYASEPAGASGGAIYLDGGQLSVFNSQFIGNHALPGTGYEFLNHYWLEATAEGGSIWTRAAHISLSNSTFAASIATAIGGGALQAQGSELRISSCLFSNNAVLGVASTPFFSLRFVPGFSNQGGALRLLASRAWITNSSFVSNSVSCVAVRLGEDIFAQGGAIATDMALDVVGSVFEGNSVIAEGGPAPARYSAGGAIFSIAPLMISSSAFRHNQSANEATDNYIPPYDAPPSHSLGGAIYAGGPSVLASSSFVGNNVIGGVQLGGPFGPGNGGIARGGALFCTNSLKATNITCASNQVSRTIHYGNSGPAEGGAIFVENSEAGIAYSTFAHDMLSEGQAVDPSVPLSARKISPLFSPGIELAAGQNAKLVLHSVILSGVSSNLLSGDILDSGYNLTSDNSLNLPLAIVTDFGTNGVLRLTAVNSQGDSVILQTTTDFQNWASIQTNLSSQPFEVDSKSNKAAFFRLVSPPRPLSRTNVDPQLGPLTSSANSPGGVDFFPLLSSSPARDSADPANFPSDDIRGVARPIGSGPDVGAVEFQSGD